MIQLRRRRESEVLRDINLVAFLEAAADNEIGIQGQVFLCFLKIVDFAGSAPISATSISLTTSSDMLLSGLRRSCGSMVPIGDEPKRFLTMRPKNSKQRDQRNAAAAEPHHPVGLVASGSTVRVGRTDAVATFGDSAAISGAASSVAGIFSTSATGCGTDSKVSGWVLTDSS